MVDGIPDWLVLGGTAGIALAASAFGFWLRHLRPNAHHRRMMRQARRAHSRLRALCVEKPGAVIAYIRKMHPHAVEELVLVTAQKTGLRVKRNKAYTGDGGIDGQILYRGRWHLVQTKRYSSAINPQHVREFEAVCLKEGKPGLFVHTGRTGRMARPGEGTQVRVVSGDRFITWISGEALAV